jgi:hypothetical protein
VVLVLKDLLDYTKELEKQGALTCRIKLLSGHKSLISRNYRQ